MKERLDVLVDKTENERDVQRRNSDLVAGPNPKIQALSRRVPMPYAADDESDQLTVSDFQATLGKNQKMNTQSIAQAASSQDTLMSPTTSQGILSRKGTNQKLQTVLETMEEAANPSASKTPSQDLDPFQTMGAQEKDTSNSISADPSDFKTPVFFRPKNASIDSASGKPDDEQINRQMY